MTEGQDILHGSVISSGWNKDAPSPSQQGRMWETVSPLPQQRKSPLFPHGHHYSKPHRSLMAPHPPTDHHFPWKMHMGSQGSEDPALRVFHHAVFKVWSWEEACHRLRLLECRPGPGAAYKLGQPLEMRQSGQARMGLPRCIKSNSTFCTPHAASLEGLVVQPMGHCGMRLPDVTQMGTLAQEVGVSSETFRSPQGGTAPECMLLKSFQLPS